MALSLFTDIPDTCYTSQLQKIEIETDATSVSLTIIHQASNYRGLLSSLTALEGGGNAATLTDVVRLSSQAVSDDGNGQTEIFQSEYANSFNGSDVVNILGEESVVRICNAYLSDIYKLYLLLLRHYALLTT